MGAKHGSAKTSRGNKDAASMPTRELRQLANTLADVQKRLEVQGQVLAKLSQEQAKERQMNLKRQVGRVGQVGHIRIMGSDTNQGKARMATGQAANTLDRRVEQAAGTLNRRVEQDLAKECYVDEALTYRNELELGMMVLEETATKSVLGTGACGWANVMIMLDNGPENEETVIAAPQSQAHTQGPAHGNEKDGHGTEKDGHSIELEGLQQLEGSIPHNYHKRHLQQCGRHTGEKIPPRMKEANEVLLQLVQHVTISGITRRVELATGVMWLGEFGLPISLTLHMESNETDHAGKAPMKAPLHWQLIGVRQLQVYGHDSCNKSILGGRDGKEIPTGTSLLGCSWEGTLTVTEAGAEGSPGGRASHCRLKSNCGRHRARCLAGVTQANV